MKKIGPSLPPGFKRGGKVKSIGPTLPPHMVSKGTVEPTEDTESVQVDTEEEDFGPKPLVGLTPEQIKEMELHLKIKEIENRSAPKLVENSSKRDDWMLKPPTKRVNPNESKSRSFSRHGIDDIDSSGWVALPGQVEKKHKPNPIPTRNTEKEIQENHSKKSLLEQHQEVRVSEPLKRFDRERDIVGGTVDAKKREKLISEAKNLSSKFSKGSFL